MVLEEKPEKVIEALGLFLQGIGYILRFEKFSHDIQQRKRVSLPFKGAICSIHNLSKSKKFSFSSTFNNFPFQQLIILLYHPYNQHKSEINIHSGSETPLVRMRDYHQHH